MNLLCITDKKVQIILPRTRENLLLSIIVREAFIPTGRNKPLTYIKAKKEYGLNAALKSILTLLFCFGKLLFLRDVQKAIPYAFATKSNIGIVPYKIPRRYRWE